MRRRKKKGTKQKVWIAVLVVAAVAAVVLGLQQAGFFRSSASGSHKVRPWRRPVEPKPIGVQIDRVSKRYPSAPAVTLPSIPKRSSAGSGKLAIILDDWGANDDLLDDVIAIKRPITLAILPSLPHSAHIAREAARHGLGVMLHMPMQAKSRSAAKEPEVITVDASEVRIRRYLDEALASVPGVRGVNNHQGSAATSDLRVMRIVLSFLKERNLFFIDSFVIASTVGPSVAQEIGVPFAKRDVFIDNEVQVESIKAQIRKAIERALENQAAIAIGHDKRATLQAVAQMVPEIERAGVRLVLAEDLVR